MKTYDADAFNIEPRWKEEVIYWEGARGYLFDAAWGVQPGRLFVPAPEDWDSVTPDWMHGRRDEIVERLRKHSHHDVIEEAPVGGQLADWRISTR